MDKESMDKNNEVVKKNGTQELNLNELDKVSGGGMMFARTCRQCGGIIGDPSVPDDFKCHCERWF